MIPYSQQHNVVSQITLTFQKGQKTYPRVSHKILDRDKMFYRYQKYETSIAGDFKFLVLWTAFRTSSGKVATFKMLNEYDKNDRLAIKKEQKRILTYQNTLKADIDFMQSKILTPGNVIGMYKKGQISVLGLVKHFNKAQLDGLSRLEKRTVTRAKLFVSYFPIIETYLED